jgi:hypothetical protein
LEVSCREPAPCSARTESRPADGACVSGQKKRGFLLRNDTGSRTTAETRQGSGGRTKKHERSEAVEPGEVGGPAHKKQKGTSSKLGKSIENKIETRAKGVMIKSSEGVQMRQDEEDESEAGSILP